MRIEHTSIPEVIIVHPDIFRDVRGYFFESFNEKAFAELVYPVHFVQDNESKSCRGVVRGLHYQKGDAAQAKLVRVIRGRVLDIAVDIRVGSPTFGKWVGAELSGENASQLFIPRGFAHGSAYSATRRFSSTSATASTILARKGRSHGMILT